MKKYLISLVVFTIALGGFSIVSASTELSLYENKLVEWGYTPYFLEICLPDEGGACLSNGQNNGVVELEQEEDEGGDSAPYYISRKFIEAEHGNSLHQDSLVILSSYLTKAGVSLNNVTEMFGGSVFLVCDSNYVIDENLSCSFSSFFGDSGDYIGLGADEFGNSTGFYVSDELFIIPEILFFDPELTTGVDQYFISLSSSREIDNNTDSTFFQEMYISPVLTELLLYALIISFVMGGLYLVVYVRAGVGVSLVSDRFLNSLESWSRQYALFALNIVFLISLFLASVFISVSFVDVGSLNLSYSSSYVRDFLKSFNAEGSVVLSNYLYLGMTFVVVCLFLIVASVFVAALVPILKGYSTNLSRLKVRSGAKFTNYLIIFIYLLLGLQVSLLPLNKYTGVLVLLFFLIFLFYKFTRAGSRSSLSTFEKVSVLVTFFIVSVFGMLLGSSPWQDQSFVTEDLIGLNTKIVTTPYEKDFDTGVVFNDYYVGTDKNLFVDNYIVYSQGYKEVINSDISNFSTTSSYVIHSSPSEAPKDYLVNKALQNASRSFNSTNNALIKDNYSENLSMVIDFNCVGDGGGSDVTVTLYSYNGDLDSKKYEYIFPMCKKTSNSYEVTLGSLEYSQTLLLIVSSSNDRVIPAIAGAKGASNISYLENMEAGPKVVKSGNNTIYNYAKGNKDFTFSYDIGLVRYNISEPINRLVEYGYISSPFTIWSDSGVVVLKNEYIDE